MSAKRKPSEGRFSVGDMVDEGDFSGMVVAGATSEITGQTGYIFMSGDGGLNFQFHDGIKSGVAMGQAQTVRDLAGRDLLAAIRSAGAEGSPRAAFKPGPTTDRDDVLHSLEHLSALVKKNGKPGSGVVKAFAMFDAEWTEEAEPTLYVAQSALVAWRELPETERRRILNGWQPRGTMPHVFNVVEETLRTAHAEAAGDFLGFHAMPDGKIFAQRETIFTHGSTERVVVQVREGTAKAEAVAELRAVLAGMEAGWDEAIATDNERCVDCLPGRAAAPATAKGPSVHAQAKSEDRAAQRRDRQGGRKVKATAV